MRGHQRVFLAVDLAFDHDDVGLLGDAIDRGDESRRALNGCPRDDQDPIAVDLVFEAADAAVEQAIERVRLSGAQAPHINGRRDGRDQHSAFRPFDQMVLEQWAIVVRAGIKPVSKSASLASVTSPSGRSVADESAAVTSQNADDTATTNRPTAGIRTYLRI